MVEFDINNYVYVQLTDVGRAELERQHIELRSLSPGMDEYVPRKEDKDGWTKFQGWVLMNTFGHMIRMTKDLPFSNTIRVEES